ncbi:hypothetical protein GCM10010507_25600 [Streptomyces cinnamoneus]|uniref:DUF732 domain-containing protein n=1 Tax=Streptomyces cinnamoneus TaxID=53446 RepID=A0A918TMN0_STRCJ|nr:hypothetical protein GCM10010507_25600 [Streptomyces cinnamoneus]
MSTGQGRATVNRRTTALLAVALTAAVLTACGSDKDGSTDSENTPPPAPTTATTAPPAPTTPTNAATPAGVPPKPDAATQAAYIRALSAISPALVGGKEDRAVSRGRDTCGTIHSFPNDHAKVVSLTQKRFSGATQVTTEQTEQILIAVQANLCPKN